MDVYVVQSVHGGTSESANDKLCRLLFFIGALKDAGAARLVPAPDSGQTSNRFYIWPAWHPGRDEAVLQPSASWFLLAHGAGNLPGLSRWRRARPA
jgi:hypothetical protein